MTDLKKELRMAQLTLDNTIKYLHRSNLTEQRDRLLLQIELLAIAIGKDKPKKKPVKKTKKTKGRKR